MNSEKIGKDQKGKMLEFPDYIQEKWFDACCENIQLWYAMGNSVCEHARDAEQLSNAHGIINRGMQES